MLEILVVKTVFSTIFNELLKLPKLFNVGVTVSVNYLDVVSIDTEAE